jgi:quinolinate synthase
MDRVTNKIKELKSKNNAVILAHTYQRPEIQEIADFVGDSLDLSLKVKSSNAKVVVFCGVRFMAETAKLISPEKTVLLPELSAGCPMADMITANELRDIKKKYPEHVVVTYVNSTAEVKAESDICCTSSNAVKIVSSIAKEKGVIFVPDANLGSYVKAQLKRDNMVLWPGYCSIHASITEQEVLELKAKYKEAVVFAHPECKTQVLNHADYILSTSAMIKKATEIKEKEIIIVTEQGILHPLKKNCPSKTFYAIQKAVCPNMKKTTIDLVLESLELMQHNITLDEVILKKARRAVERMLEVV